VAASGEVHGFERLLTSGREGLLVAPQDDPAAFASALVHLLGSPAELVRMGAEGRVTATTRYAWSNVAAELETYYLELRGELPVTAELGTAAEVGEAPARV
jgi:glycosyltransferase involved in cell wall biosynthesis